MFMFCCSCFGIQDDKILNDETGFVKHIDYIEEGETNKQIVDVLIKSGDFKGQEVEIENVDNGMMAIKINKGMNNVKFTYYPRGLKLGLWLSIVSYIGLLIYCIKSKRCS